MRGKVAGAFVEGDVLAVRRHGGVELMLVGVIEKRLWFKLLGIHHHQPQQRTGFIEGVHDLGAAFDVAWIPFVGAVLCQSNDLR